MTWAVSSQYHGTEDGNWPTLAVWLGDPPQLLNAYVSTSGTKLRVPIDSSCHENANVRLPDYGRNEWHHPRYYSGDLPEAGQYARVQYIAQKSMTWESSVRCSKGSDILRGVLWRPQAQMDDVWLPMEQARVPVEETDGIASIGMRAIAATWNGKQDYWWTLITQPMTSLLQSLPILFPGIELQDAGFMYTYTLGAVYSMLCPIHLHIRGIPFLLTFA